MEMFVLEIPYTWDIWDFDEYGGSLGWDILELWWIIDGCLCRVPISWKENFKAHVVKPVCVCVFFWTTSR